MDSDAAGQEATARLAQAFGSRLIQVQLPATTKDPADLARLPEGSALFQDAMRQAVDHHSWPIISMPIIQPASATWQQQGILPARVQGPDCSCSRRSSLQSGGA
jgi:hypothetical protein